ncbi:hypothetical protein A4D02_06565 [Niastella koreensis]|uniref:NERD domain protein n=2 Tax=Niastella koreensis TaxID=354356 RepID=G8TG59_NIAKG|nr:NERD domain-containing protein [Niastella koreensis]AEW01662.1 NERD domain protein [Niastella koreensis GR20-10]OQP48373.1 hypothetical protein A4D02_06565 [Niastella koreensis]
MALMIPHSPMNPYEGEEVVFRSLQTALDDDYVVFHSVKWVASSAKSQGEADFLILHKRLGILIIEVKGGYVRTTERLWFQQNRATLLENEMQDPLSQADNSKWKFIEALKQANPPVNGCLVCHAVWFPSFKWSYPFPPNYAPEIVFDQETLIDPQPAIEKAFAYWGEKIFHSIYDHACFNRLKFIIAPEFSAVPSVRSNFENREQLFISLTREQARIMDFLEEQRIAVISGSAGTGKTMLALEKANRLGVKNEDTLFLCYNEALKDHLAANNQIRYVHFKTIYELADDYFKYDKHISLNDLTDQLVDHAWSGKDEWKYKHVIVDEAQDFNSFFIEFLKEITSGCFYAFYDKNQCIFQDTQLEWANNAECKITLHTNCRNTKEIARTSARNIGLDSKTFINSPIKGEQSFITEYSCPEEGIQMIERIVTKLLKEKLALPEDIVILTMKNWETSILRTKKNICQKPFSRLLKSGYICVNTVGEFKGLEAGYLIITEIEVNKYVDSHYRNRLYIGCSRAKQGLYMLLDNPQEEDFAVAMEAIEPKKKVKKNKINFFQKLAVSELAI